MAPRTMAAGIQHIAMEHVNLADFTHGVLTQIKCAAACGGATGGPGKATGVAPRTRLQAQAHRHDTHGRDGGLIGGRSGVMRGSIAGSGIW